ncbi:MAG TPA: pullulanase-associated domain-containing protein [Trueperaceae bacterium]|nr:pullulanase-associated domain-containing protein [Trueperaceae bacterium]
MAVAAPALAQSGPGEDSVRIHYQRADGSYDGWVLHVWEDTLEEVTWGAGLAATGTDDYGVYWDVRLAEGAARLGFIVHMGDTKDPGPDMFLEPARHGREIWLVSGSDVIHTAPPLAPPETGVARVHYLNPAGDLDGWVLHVWEDTIEQVTWEAGLPPTGEVPGGLYWDVRLADDAEQLGLIIHRGDEKDPGPDIFVDVAALRSAQEVSDDRGIEVWLVSGSTTLHTQRPDLASVGGGDLRAARAYWVTRDLVV